MIKSLPRVEIEGHEPTLYGNDRHPMRVMTRRIAGLESGEWDDGAREEVVDVFDTLAPEWHTRSSPMRSKVVADAFERGVDQWLQGRVLALEVGSGIGTYTSIAASRFETVVSIDLSEEMVARAPIDTSRVVADGGQLPVKTDASDAVVLINAFAFPTELERVLKVGGLLVWVNSSGEDTPIHLTTADLVTALPFAVEGVESRAGAGTWCVLRRLSL